MANRWASSFRKVLGWLLDHLRAERHAGYYALTLGFLALSLGLNYGLMPGRTLEQWMNGRFEGLAIYPAYLVFYGLPFAAGLLSYAACFGQWAMFRQRDTWVRLLFALIVVAADAAFYHHRGLPSLAETPGARYLLRKLLNNASSLLTIGAALSAFYLLYERKREGWYGLQAQGFDFRPYLLLLGLMLPLVAAASFDPSFIRYYPTLRPERLQTLESLPPWAAALLYEAVYSLDFLWEEWLMRGFFILGLAGVLGRGAVMPMAMVYCFRHFAKPFGEALSSIFGGYILGVLALRSRSILGGVLIHVGIALMMELAAYLQHLAGK
jgi:hypothetical protein